MTPSTTIAVIADARGPVVRHDDRVRDPKVLTGRWWNWEVARWDAAAFQLIADNDLTYHHNAEISFTDVAVVERLVIHEPANASVVALTTADAVPGERLSHANPGRRPG